MPRRNIHKDDLYAANLAKGMSQNEAYAAAGYKPDRGNAAKKAKAVEAKVQAIKQSVVQAFVVDEKWVLNEMVENYKSAKAAEEYHVCQKQLRDIGGHFQMFIDRKDIRLHAKFEGIPTSDLIRQLTEVTTMLALEDNSTESAE